MPYLVSGCIVRSPIAQLLHVFIANAYCIKTTVQKSIFYQWSRYERASTKTNGKLRIDRTLRNRQSRMYNKNVILQCLVKYWIYCTRLRPAENRIYKDKRQIAQASYIWQWWTKHVVSHFVVFLYHPYLFITVASSLSSRPGEWLSFWRVTSKSSYLASYRYGVLIIRIEEKVYSNMHSININPKPLTEYSVPHWRPYIEMLLSNRQSRMHNRKSHSTVFGKRLDIIALVFVLQYKR